MFGSLLSFAMCDRRKRRANRSLQMLRRRRNSYGSSYRYGLRTSEYIHPITSLMATQDFVWCSKSLSSKQQLGKESHHSTCQDQPSGIDFETEDEHDGEQRQDSGEPVDYGGAPE